MKEQQTQRTQLLVFGQYKRANKQHIQSSKNIKKLIKKEQLSSEG